MAWEFFERDCEECSNPTRPIRTVQGYGGDIYELCVDCREKYPVLSLEAGPHQLM